MPTKEPEEEQVLRAFRACPKLSPDQAAELCPEIMQVVNLIGNTLGVCWQWVLAALLGIAGGLVPQARYELAPSVEVQSAMWVLLLQPGATNSSGTVKLVVQTVQLLMDWLHQLETQEHQQVLATATAADTEKPQRPVLRHLLAGGGSLAATGVQMSLKHNRCAALCAEPELQQLLAWFGGESGIDSGVVAKCWDGTQWDRPVMDKAKAFTVPEPWLGIITAGHISESFKATQKDIFGFRQRITCLFGEPLWLTMAQTRSNYQKLPIASHKPAEFLAALMFPLLVWSVKQDRLVYTASTTDGARDVADANFDGHVSCQQEAFLRPGRHEDARYHGKLRTKFDRVTLAAHFLSSICKSFVALMAANPAGHVLEMKKNWCPYFSVLGIVGRKIHIHCGNLSCWFRCGHIIEYRHRFCECLSESGAIVMKVGKAQPGTRLARMRWLWIFCSLQV